MRSVFRFMLRKYYSEKSDSELLNTYYDLLYDCLGSVSEFMIEEDYPVSDILEREEYEDQCKEQLALIEDLFLERGINPFS